MSSKRTLFLAVLFVLLGAYFFLFEGVSVEAPVPDWREGPRILTCPAAGITSLHVQGARGRLVAERVDGEWRVASSPQSERSIQHAVQSLAQALCELPVIDDIPEPETLGEFGLEEPVAEIRASADGWSTVLLIGSLTPANNLLYAKRADERPVLKVGALLRSEVDKVLAHAGPAL